MPKKGFWVCKMEKTFWLLTFHDKAEIPWLNNNILLLVLFFYLIFFPPVS